MRPILIAITLAALSACTTVQGSRVVVPTLKEWSPAMQTEAARELEDMSQKGLYPVSRALLRDYISLRDQVRAAGSK